MKRAVWVVFLFLTGSLSAGSILLVNDSANKLRAVVRGADGSQLGEMILNPRHSIRWSDGYGNTKNQSETPYTVLWFCLSGDPYATCTAVPTGGTVTALGCEGARACKPEKKKKPGTQQPPPGEDLQNTQPVPPEESP